MSVLLRLFIHVTLATCILFLINGDAFAQAIRVNTPPGYTYFQVAFGEQTTLVPVFMYENGRTWDRGGVIWTAHPSAEGAGPKDGVVCGPGSTNNVTAYYASSACVMITNSVAGTFTVTATVAGSGAPVATFTVLNYANVTLASTPLATAIAGASYSGAINGRDGSSPLTYSLSSGALPPGIALSSNGILSGKPITVGTFAFDVSVTDNGNIYGQRSTATAPFTLTVGAPSLSLNSAAPTTATFGSSYSYNVAGSGGTLPYSYSIASGAFPSGLTLSSAGVISGTPTQTGSFSVTVSMRDSTTGTGSPFQVNQALNFVVNPLSTNLSIVSQASTAKDAPVTFMAQGLPLTATGSVSFWIDGINLGNASVNNGSASITSAGLQPGNHNIAAIYNGDGDHAPSAQASVIHTVNRGATSVTLSQPSGPLLPGGTVVATVSDAQATGDVTFELDGVMQAPAQPVVSGVASYILPQLSPGSHTLIAHYNGNESYESAQSAPTVFDVQNTATVTLKVLLNGQDGTITFSSPTSALNVSVGTSGGLGQSPAIALLPGAYEVTAVNGGGVGSSLIGLSCSDDNSSTSPASRTANIVLDIAESVVCTFSAGPSAKQTQTQISEYMESRGNFLLANQPSLSRRIARLNGDLPESAIGGALMTYLPQLTSSEGFKRANASLAAIDAAAGNMEPNRFDIWLDGTFSILTSGNSEATAAALTLGADYLLTNEMLLGGFVQLDTFAQSAPAGTSRAQGQGWMAGSYLSTKLSEQFYVDLLAGIGTASNKLSPLGTFTDEFQSVRYLLSATATGELQWDALTLEPRAQFSYFYETSDSYVDTLGTSISSVSNGTGQLAFGPGLRYRLLENGLVSVDTGLRVDVLAALSSWQISPTFQNRFEADVRFQFTTGANLSISGNYVGLGSDERAASVRANLLLSLP